MIGQTLQTAAPVLTHKLRLSPQMRQALHILQLPLLDLKTYLLNELTTNPILEEDFSASRDRAGGMDPEEKDFFQNNLPGEAASLEGHLLGQLGLLNISSRQRALTKEIIANLNEDGYLAGTLPQIVEECGASLREAEEALSIVQSLDPKGVGARNLEECLLLQIERESPAALVVRGHLADLKMKRFGKIARGLGMSLSEVQNAVREIRRLNPKPGQNFGVSRPFFAVPELVVYRAGRAYKVKYSGKELPVLRISPTYQKLLTAANVPLETKQYVTEKIRSALELIKAVHERGLTVQRVASCVVSEQKEFFEKGPSVLKPLTFEKVAGLLNIHKSTVWRAAAGKYMETPSGVVELKSLFSSARSVQTRVQDILKSEDPKKPLSDERLVEILRREGIEAARRTVAKYREALKILPSYLRKK